MIDLVPMNEDDLNEYLNTAILTYAKEKVTSGSWRQEQSLELSLKEFKRHLPDGISTKGHYIFNLLDTSTNRKVGMIWIGTDSPEGDREEAWIWDFLINEEERGKGFGREALLALDTFLIRMGKSKVSLHVFGHNQVAINLYKKSRYYVTDLVMSKNIDAK